MNIPDDLTTLDDARFMELWTEVGAEAGRLRQETRRFAREHDRRLTEAAARARYDALTDGERAALAQVFTAQGIESEEKFNG